MRGLLGTGGRADPPLKDVADPLLTGSNILAEQLWPLAAETVTETKPTSQCLLSAAAPAQPIRVHTNKPQRYASNHFNYFL